MKKKETVLFGVPECYSVRYLTAASPVQLSHLKRHFHHVDWPVLLRRFGSWHSRRNTALKNCVGRVLFPDDVHHSSRVLPFTYFVFFLHGSNTHSLFFFSSSAVACNPPRCVNKPLFSHSFRPTKPSLATSYEASFTS